MNMSEAFSISFYIAIKLCYIKALSDQASSLAPDRIPLLQRPQILALFMTLSHSVLQVYANSLLEARGEQS